MIMDNAVVCPSVLIRSECFQHVGLFDDRVLKQYSEDWDMWLKIAYSYDIGSIKEPLLYYRVHNRNMSKVYFRKHCRNKLITLKRHAPRIHDAGYRRRCIIHNLSNIEIASVHARDIKVLVLIGFAILYYYVYGQIKCPRILV